MSKDLYVIAEQRDGVIAKVTLELLGEATKLAVLATVATYSAVFILPSIL